jgi:hypothetical protein
MTLYAGTSFRMTEGAGATQDGATAAVAKDDGRGWWVAGRLSRV